MTAGRLLVNAVSCRQGGGITDLKGTIPVLASALDALGWSIEVCVSENGQNALAEVDFPESRSHLVRGEGWLSRARWEMVGYPTLANVREATVAMQFSNFAPKRLGIPQLVVLRNAKYFLPPRNTVPKMGKPTLRDRLGRRLTRRTMNNADAIVYCSHSLRAAAQHMANTSATQIVAQLGCEAPPLDLASVQNNPRDALRAVASPQAITLCDKFDDAVRLALNVSHAGWHKNLEDFFRALVDLRDSGERVIGITTSGITHATNPWKSKSRESMLANEVVRSGALYDLGAISRKDVWRVMAACDLFVFPSSVESFGHPLLEAQRAGVPIVASDVAVHREVSGEGALFYPLGDVSTLTERMRQLLNDATLRARQIERGKKNAAKFTWEAHVETLVNAILHLARRHELEN